jgi:hypothetical protein
MLEACANVATVSAEKASDSKELISSKSRTEGLVDEPIGFEESLCSGTHQ